MAPDDPQGMKRIVHPFQREAGGKRETLVVSECFCPNGHSLIYARANFSGYAGILLKVTGEKGTGHIVLSPIYGEKSRISLEIDLTEGEILIVHCPFCGTVFPRMAACPCGADLIILHTSSPPDEENCIGICNRVGCSHAEVRTKGDLILLSMMTDLVD